MSQPAGPTRSEVDLAGAKVLLHFADREALVAFFQEAFSCQAFMVRLAEPPEPFASLDFVARSDGGSELAFRATSVQTFPRESGFEAAFQFVEDIEAMRQRLDSALGAPGPADGVPDPDIADEAETGEVQGTSPIFRIRQLDTPERVQLAMKADRGERTILCRDTMAPVLQALFSNPRLDGENILAIAKSPYATPDILQRIAADRRWLANADIRIALVRNPKTPTPIAQRLLETLPLNELRTLAKTGNSKEELRRVALALVTKAFTSR